MRDQATTAYLSQYEFLRTRDLDESRAVMSRVWGEHRVTPTTRTPFKTAINHAKIGQAGLTFVDCRTPLLIECAPHGDSYTIVFHEEGMCQHTTNGQVALSTSDSSAIWTPGQEYRLDTGQVRMLCLDLSRGGVEEGLDVRGSALAQSAPSGPTIDVTAGSGASLWSLCRWAARELDRPDTPLMSGLASAHLEQTLLTLFLQSLGSGMPPPAADRGDRLGKMKLADLENWIQANLREPISVETLAGVAGVSTRALQMAFRRHRDCTPLEFVRQARLKEVRRVILLRGPDASITGIAGELGFLHLGRFAQSYRRLFGESPSDTRRQA